MRPLGRLCSRLAGNVRDSGEGRIRVTWHDRHRSQVRDERSKSSTGSRRRPPGRASCCPGIGRIGAVEGLQVRVDCFESVAAPVVDSRWVPADECHPATLLPQTRVYWQNPDTGVWATGRVIGGEPRAYFIRLPNSQFDVKVPESELRVRWDRPVADPLDVLIAGANESPYFRDARLPMLRSLVSQRAACAGTYALLSASVEIYPHQISAALTVLSDPVRRYLLADEVGLGKTIEAGLIIRQVLLDHPRSKIVVIAPDALRLQWQSELRDKFFTGDFPEATIKIICS